MSDVGKHKSSRAGHPDVGAVLPKFVARLAGHVARLRELVASGDREGLRRLVHQVRGNGTTYGFEEMTRLAAEVEEGLLAGWGMQEVAEGVGRLVGYMEGVEGYGE